jgi:hypothetical protein
MAGDFDSELYESYETAAPAFDEPEVGEGAEPLPDPVFASLQDFVEDYLLVIYRRGTSGHQRTWCAQWWRHPEAWIRLDALWRSWEYLRLDRGTGMSVWIRDHADPHMNVLLSPDHGPFFGCKPDEHARRALEPLPSSPIPESAADPTRIGVPD